MRPYIMCVVFEAESDDLADATLEDIMTDVPAADGMGRVIHGCVREMETRRTCPECEEVLDA